VAQSSTVDLFTARSAALFYRLRRQARSAPSRSAKTS